MILKSLDSSDLLELSIKRFEYPYSSTLDKMDLEWVVVDMKASKADRSWTSTDATLTYREAGWLAFWLDKLAKNQQADGVIEFTEPNLSFELVERSADHSIVRIYFEGESIPLWAKSYNRLEDDWHQFSIDLSIDNSCLLEASTSLLADLEALPPREGVNLEDGKWWE